MADPVRLSEIVTACPVPPTNHSPSEVRRVWQHREKLKQITVRVVEKERSSRHPCKCYWLLGRVSRKVEWGYIGGPKMFRRFKQIRNIHSEGEVKAQPLWSRPYFPQAEHRPAPTPDPVERYLSFPKT